MKKRDPQLVRFCLYGFLKNQLYFEPFLILAFREKGLSFTMIGVLIAFRAVCVNLMEIPSGAAADVWGRKRSMMVSMVCYVFSFVIFALVRNPVSFFPAMFAFAVGEAFRTGTHKAMIFDWLIQQGRQDEKTGVYGLTRSWSKIGSSLNAFMAAAIVISTKSYVWIFWLSVIPYLFNMVNFCFYPDSLNGVTAEQGGGVRYSAVRRTLSDGLRLCLRKKSLRTLILENICVEGYFSTAKEYLQPLLKAAVLSTPVFLSVSERDRTALLVAVVYAVLNLLGSAAARNSHRAVEYCGGVERFSGKIKMLALIAYVISAAGFVTGISALPIAGFIALAVMLNVWKPVFSSRFYENAEQDSAATTLSIANQSKTLSVAIMAPLLGSAVDCASGSDSPAMFLWPVAAAGIGVMFLGLLIRPEGESFSETV